MAKRDKIQWQNKKSLNSTKIDYVCVCGDTVANGREKRK